VNVAARMESHGVSGEIQVTSQVAARLRDRGYVLRERGQVALKGRGTAVTWFLDAAPDTRLLADAPPVDVAGA
jgi:class 3 adenylate cyclase